MAKPAKPAATAPAPEQADSAAKGKRSGGAAAAVPESVAPVMQPATPSAPPAPPAPPQVTAPQPAPSGAIPRLLTREQCQARAEKALGAKTLSGAVGEVIRLAASPRSNVADLAPLIARDAMLSARVLQAANSAAYVSSKGVVSTIPEAVRQIGLSTVRQIASAMAVFDAMPASEADGFNPVRCWQHSFAVAMLCERLAGQQKEGAKDPAAPGVAYLVGLCHDLGEILFHTHFGREYAEVLATQAATGRSPDDVERQMIGMTRGELVQTIIKCLGLPDSIKEPIGAFHGTGGTTAGAAAAGPASVARILKAAELYANGLLLASSSKALVAPLTRAECKAAVGRDDPPAPDATTFRSEVLYTTGMLARLSEAEAEEVMKPLFGRTDARLWVAREASLSAFDAVTAALGSLGEVTVRDRLPGAPELENIDGLVVLAPSDLTAGFTGPEIGKVTAAAGKPLPVLWLVARAMFGAPKNGGQVRGGQPQPLSALKWPVGIERLAEFVTVCVARDGKPTAAAA